MAAVAWLGATQLPMHLIYFYLGAAELSSIPLVVHDQLVRSWTSTTNNINTKNTLASRLAQWRIRTALPVVTALSFTAVRAVWFPYVTLRHFLPSVHHVLTTATTASTTTVAVQNALRATAVAAVGFMLLQWYWFVTQIVLVAIVPRRRPDNQPANHTRD